MLTNYVTALAWIWTIISAAMIAVASFSSDDDADTGRTGAVGIIVFIFSATWLIVRYTQ